MFCLPEKETVFWRSFAETWLNMEELQYDRAKGRLGNKVDASAAFSMDEFINGAPDESDLIAKFMAKKGKS